MDSCFNVFPGIFACWFEHCVSSGLVWIDLSPRVLKFPASSHSPTTFYWTSVNMNCPCDAGCICIAINITVLHSKQLCPIAFAGLFRGNVGSTEYSASYSLLKLLSQGLRGLTTSLRILDVVKRHCPYPWVNNRDQPCWGRWTVLV